MGTALLWGAGAGLGLTLLVYGLAPPRLTLAAALRQLRQPAPPRRGPRWRHGLAAPLSTLGLPRRHIMADLALLDRDPTRHLADQAAATLLGMLATPMLVLAVAPTAAPAAIAAGLVGAVLGWWWVDAHVHARAEQRRRELRYTLSTVLDLVTVSLAGGAGVEQAIDDAAAIATGWAADQLRQALHIARTTRVPPWETLGALGTETAVPELETLAAAMALAGMEGAKVRASLTARAAALRTGATADMETDANAASERMSLPVMLLGLGYLLFLLFPALAAIDTGL